MMNARLLLLVLAALATCPRLGRAQGDPLPPSLVDLVMHSPISNVDDLKRLLDLEEEYEKPRHEIHSNGTRRRLPRSLSVQVAQQAMCKVRTEVMEVTRAMLDKRNANFLLWPPCVEVQRCSGCCNTRVQHCTPVVVETRHLQMTKIQFVNRQPVYEKVIIPVDDHVTCSCQSRASPATPRIPPTAFSPPRAHTKDTSQKSQRKEDLHRHDESKHHQRLHLEERESQEVPSKVTQGQRQSPDQRSFTHMPVLNRAAVPTSKTTLGHTHMMSDARPRDVEEHLTNSKYRKSTMAQHFDQHQHEKTTPMENSQSFRITQGRKVGGLTHTYSQIEVIGQSSGQSEAESRSASQSESLHHHTEMSVQNGEKHHDTHHPHHRHHHHHHATEAASSPRTVTKAPPTTPSAPKTPRPLQPPRKRRRKHRKRISKASMRAMILVMS